MKTIKEQIEVMKALSEGKPIIYKEKGSDFWTVFSLLGDHYNFDWEHFDYCIKKEPKTRPMTLEEIIEWRKDSNGVVLWGDEITTVTDIYPKDKPDKICLSNCGWQSLDDFIKCARTPYGEKFEVEIEE